jgi:hypothetical protein
MTRSTHSITWRTLRAMMQMSADQPTLSKIYIMS